MNSNVEFKNFPLSHPDQSPEPYVDRKLRENLQRARYKLLPIVDELLKTPTNDEEYRPGQHYLTFQQYEDSIWASEVIRKAHKLCFYGEINKVHYKPSYFSTNRKCVSMNLKREIYVDTSMLLELIELNQMLDDVLSKVGVEVPKVVCMTTECIQTDPISESSVVSSTRTDENKSKNENRILVKLNEQFFSDFMETGKCEISPVYRPNKFIVMSSQNIGEKEYASGLLPPLREEKSIHSSSTENESTVVNDAKDAKNVVVKCMSDLDKVRIYLDSKKVDAAVMTTAHSSSKKRVSIIEESNNVENVCNSKTPSENFAQRKYPGEATVKPVDGFKRTERKHFEEETVKPVDGFKRTDRKYSEAETVKSVDGFKRLCVSRKKSSTKNIGAKHVDSKLERSSNCHCAVGSADFGNPLLDDNASKIVICIRGENDEEDLRIVIKQSPDGMENVEQVQYKTRTQELQLEGQTMHYTEEHVVDYSVAPLPCVAKSALKRCELKKPDVKPSEGKKSEEKKLEVINSEVKQQGVVLTETSMSTSDHQSEREILAFHNKGSKGSLSCSCSSEDTDGIISAEKLLASLDKQNVIAPNINVIYNVLDPGKSIVNSKPEASFSKKLNSQTYPAVDCSKIELNETVNLCVVTGAGEQLMLSLKIRPKLQKEASLLREVIDSEEIFMGETAGGQSSRNLFPNLTESEEPTRRFSRNFSQDLRIIPQASTTKSVETVRQENTISSQSQRETYASPSRRLERILTPIRSEETIISQTQKEVYSRQTPTKAISKTESIAQTSLSDCQCCAACPGTLQERYENRFESSTQAFAPPVNDQATMSPKSREISTGKTFTNGETDMFPPEKVSFKDILLFSEERIQERGQQNHVENLSFHRQSLTKVGQAGELLTAPPNIRSDQNGECKCCVFCPGVSPGRKGYTFDSSTQSNIPSPIDKSTISTRNQEILTDKYVVDDWTGTIPHEKGILKDRSSSVTDEKYMTTRRRSYETNRNLSQQDKDLAKQHNVEELIPGLQSLQDENTTDEILSELMLDEIITKTQKSQTLFTTPQQKYDDEQELVLQISHSRDDGTQEDRVIPLSRTKICSSLEFDVTVVDTRLRTGAIENANPRIIVRLNDLGVDNLLRACKPAKCCRRAVLGEKSKKCLPYSASLRSLPLNDSDVTIIKQSLEMNVQKVKNSTDLQRVGKEKDNLAYYILLENKNPNTQHSKNVTQWTLHNPHIGYLTLVNYNQNYYKEKMFYYINLVNDLKSFRQSSLSYKILYFEVVDSNILNKPSDDSRSNQVSSPKNFSSVIKIHNCLNELHKRDEFRENVPKFGAGCNKEQSKKKLPSLINIHNCLNEFPKPDRHTDNFPKFANNTSKKNRNLRSKIPVFKGREVNKIDQDNDEEEKEIQIISLQPLWDEDQNGNVHENENSIFNLLHGVSTLEEQEVKNTNVISEQSVNEFTYAESAEPSKQSVQLSLTKSNFAKFKTKKKKPEFFMSRSRSQISLRVTSSYLRYNEVHNKNIGGRKHSQVFRGSSPNAGDNNKFCELSPSKPDINECSDVVVDYLAYLLYNMIISRLMKDGRALNHLEQNHLPFSQAQIAIQTDRLLSLHNMISETVSKGVNPAEIQDKCHPSTDFINVKLQNNKFENLEKNIEKSVCTSITFDSKLSKLTQSLQTSILDFDINKYCQIPEYPLSMQKTFLTEHSDSLKRVFPKTFRTNEELCTIQTKPSCDKFERFVVVFKSDRSIKQRYSEENVTAQLNSLCSSTSLTNPTETSISSSLIKLKKTLDEYESNKRSTPQSEYQKSTSCQPIDYMVYQNNSTRSVFENIKDYLCCKSFTADEGVCNKCGCYDVRNCRTKKTTGVCSCPGEKKSPPHKKKSKRSHKQSKKNQTCLSKSFSSIKKSLTSIFKCSKGVDADLCACSKIKKNKANNTESKTSGRFCIPPNTEVVTCSEHTQTNCQCKQCENFDKDGVCKCSHCVGIRDKSVEANVDDAQCKCFGKKNGETPQSNDPDEKGSDQDHATGDSTDDSGHKPNATRDSTDRDKHKAPQDPNSIKDDDEIKELLSSSKTSRTSKAAKSNSKQLNPMHEDKSNIQRKGSKTQSSIKEDDEIKELLSSSKTSRTSKAAKSNSKQLNPIHEDKSTIQRKGSKTQSSEKNSQNLAPNDKTEEVTAKHSKTASVVLDDQANENLTSEARLEDYDTSSSVLNLSASASVIDTTAQQQYYVMIPPPAMFQDFGEPHLITLPEHDDQKCWYDQNVTLLTDTSNQDVNNQKNFYYDVLEDLLNSS